MMLFQKLKFQILVGVVFQRRIEAQCLFQVRFSGEFVAATGCHNRVQITRHRIGILHFVERLNGTFVVFVQQLGECRAVANRLREIGLSLCEIAFCKVQIAQSLAKTIGTDGVRNVFLSLRQFTVSGQSDPNWQMPRGLFCSRAEPAADTARLSFPRRR